LIEEQLTLSLEELPARVSQLLDSEKGLKTQEETSPSPSLEWLTTTAQSGLSGRMSPVFCHPAEDGTLVPSLGRWQVSGMGSPTECLTLSTSECHSEGVESLLSHILQEIQDVPQKYYLSQKACEGYLRRQATKGKLPMALQEAMKQKVESGA
jgi:hypothetical protein